MRKFWDWYALIYDSLRHLLPYQELLKQTIEALNIQEDTMRILDAGCGTGNVALALQEARVQHVHWKGIDFSEAMVARAKAKLRLTPWASIKKGNLNEPLPYSHASFDRVVCLNALYAVSDPRAILKEFSRVLTFGGILVLANPRKNPSIKDVLSAHLTSIQGLTGRRKYALLMKTFATLPSLSLVALLNRVVIKRMARQGTYHFFDIEELVTLLENSGFRILQKKFLYGNTTVFLVVTKILSVRNQLGEPMTAEIAHTHEDFTALYRLRYDVYCEEMRSLNQEAYPRKEEKDKYDAYAVHFLLRSNGIVIGTLRLIKETPWGFLVEEHFSLPENFPRKKAIEPSRLVIKKEFRGCELLRLLFSAAEMWSEEHGYTHWCFAAQTRLTEFYDSIGWNIQRLSPPAIYHHLPAIPGIRILGNKLLP